MSESSDTRKTWGAALTLLRSCLGGCLVYGVVFQVLSTLLLAPFFVWAHDRALALGGSPVATNFDIAGAVLSLAGVATMLVGALGAAILGVLGIGGHVVITAAADLGRKPRLRDVAVEVLRATPRLFQPALWRIGLFVLALLPVLVMVLHVLRDAILDVDNFYLQVVPASPLGATAFFVVLTLAAAGLYTVVVRWVFVLHAFLLERRGLGAAMDRSSELVKASHGRVLRTVLLFHALLVVLPLLGTVLMRGLVVGTFSAMGDAPDPAVFILVATFLLLIWVVTTTLFIAVAVAFGAALATVLFRQLGGRVERITEDDRRAGLLTRRQTVLAVLLLFLAGALLTTPRVVAIATKELRSTGITAHRGSSAVAPENSMAAFRQAIDDGADRIELDVMETKDRGIICVHDVNLLRLTGIDKAVYEVTLEEIQRLDSGSHFDPRFSHERMPTLKQVIDLVRGRIRLNIEVKTHGHEQDFPASLVRLIRDEGFGDQCVVTSLDNRALAQVRAADPGLRIGLIVTASVGNVHALDVDFYSVEQANATPAFIRQAHAKDREVHVWTVNRVERMHRLMDRGVDDLITDHPYDARGARDGRDAADDIRGALVRIFGR